MTKPKYEYPRSKVQTRNDDPATLTATIPGKMVHAMWLQAGDTIEWIWVTEGLQSYCKAVKVQEYSSKTSQYFRGF